MTTETRVTALESKMSALELDNALMGQRFNSFGDTLDEVKDTFKTGQIEMNTTFQRAMDQSREDRQAEIAAAALERESIRKENRWWWTKAFGVGTSALTALSALAGGAYYMSPPAQAAPTIEVPDVYLRPDKSHSSHAPQDYPGHPQGQPGGEEGHKGRD